MAAIDRVKFDGLATRDWLVYKHPSEKLVVGTQLIVAEGQIALFMKGGQICDEFTPGTYTLNAQNLPLLHGIVNIPFGGKTPFSAEIFYLNTITKLDVQWGTSDPITIVDPKYSTRLRIRAFGQMGLKLQSSKIFLRELVGTMQQSEYVQYTKLQDFFRGLIVQRIKVIIADIILNKKISALEITPRLDEISDLTKQKIEEMFDKYGLEVVGFFIKSINFPDEDFDAINAVLHKRAEFELMGDARYSTSRTFDVYETAAGNSSGVAGAFVAGGIGLGAGAALGGQMPQAMANTAPGGIICAACSTSNPSSGRFCLQCGKSLEPSKCPQCGTELGNDARFCHKCGKEVGNE